MKAPFAPSLFVEIRKRMGQTVFDVFQSAIIDSVEEVKAKGKKRFRDTSAQDNNEPLTVIT